MFQLSDNDIHLAAQATTKQQAIALVADALYQTGCVEYGYLQGMLEREAQMNTYLGNGIAIPHGSLTTRALVKKTGVQLFQFPQGVDWGDGHIAYLVIGIAADSDVHLALLRQLTRILDDKKSAQQLATAQDVQQVRAIIMGETTSDFLIESESISLAVETESLLTLTALNAAKLQQLRAVNNEFITEAITSPALPLGNGIWLTDATVGNQRNAIALSRAKKTFTNNGKVVQVVITIAAIDDHINSTLACLLDEQVQNTLLTGQVAEILTLFTPQQTESALDNVIVLAGQVPAIESIVTLHNEHGLHSRPAAILVNHIKKYNASIAVQNLDNESQLISAKSVMKVMSLGAQKGHRLRFVATGADAKQALKEISKLIASGLGESSC